MSATLSAPPPGGAAPPPPPPGAGAGGPPPPAPDTGDDSGTVVLTVTMGDDGTFTVYAGDEPDSSGDMSEDDADAMGAAGDQAAPQGQPATSVGQVLKMAMDILQAAKPGGGAGPSAEDQFAAGFGGGGGAPGGAPGQ